MDDLEEVTERGYDVCVLSRCVNKEEAYILLKKIRAYTLFFLDDVDVDKWTKWICTSRRAKVLDIQTLQNLLKKIFIFTFQIIMERNSIQNPCQFRKALRAVFSGMDILVLNLKVIMGMIFIKSHIGDIISLFFKIKLLIFG